MQDATDKRYPERQLALLAGVVMLSCACGQPAATGETRHACDAAGRLSVELHGAIRASLDWNETELLCEGMPRPDGAGARLRFAGPLATARGERSIAFILALPDLEEGTTGVELPTKVTLMAEGAGRFFGTQDTRGCWTDISAQEPVGPRDARDFRISGILYCVSALAELNGGASVGFTELTFTGRLNWNSAE